MTSKATLLGLCALLIGSQSALAQRRSTAETSLVGIKLYDGVLHLLDVYGSPDDIEPVSLTVGGGAGGPGGPGGPRGGGIPGGGAGGPGGPPAGALPPGFGPRGNGFQGGVDFSSPFGFGDDVLRAQGGPPPGSIPPEAQARIAAAIARAGGGGGPGGPPAGPATGGAPALGGPTVTVTYTRWIYKRGGAKYGFILDPNGRVVQIEAIGLENNKVKTRKGIGFGATFAKVLRTYGLPDSWDIGGNTIVMRYLIHDKVVFRLNRLGRDKPHVVTGILVAAGKK